MRYPHVASLIYNQPWAILPEKLEVIADTFELLRTGARFERADIQARIEAAGRGAPGGMRSAGALAVIPIYGTIAQRGSMIQDASGGCSTDQIGGQIAQALADPGVAALLLDISSPGGTCYGVQELAQQIYDARGSKPICAIANSMAASAAYWIASAADEIVATPGGDVGSIGAYMVYQDCSKALEAEGISTTIIKSGSYKAEATGLTPLTPEATQALQDRCDEVYGQFCGMVAKGRGVPVAQVRDGMGQGRLLSARAALAAGMVDRIATFDQTVSRLSANARGTGRMRAEDDAGLRRYRLAFTG